MSDFKRLINNLVNPKASYLILGPRQTGKSTFVSTLDIDFKVDLLLRDLFLLYNQDPDLLYRELSELSKNKNTVWIDEIQKIPALLDIVHKVMFERPHIKFLLSGSSARKLKRNAANLLGGRAIDIRMHPLTIEEIGEEFDLDWALQFGTLPNIYRTVKIDKEKNLAEDLLGAYINTYLEQEIIDEALTRNLASFQRFLLAASIQGASEVNYSSIAKDTQTNDELVKNYYSILEDTLIGFYLHPYHKSKRKRLSKTPKFYFFDNGVMRAGAKEHRSTPSNQDRGRLFEQFVIQELRRVNDYYRKDCEFFFWSTTDRAEVDILIERGNKPIAAIECKSSRTISAKDLSGLRSFNDEYPKVPKIICANIENKQSLDSGFKATAMNLPDVISFFKSL